MTGHERRGALIWAVGAVVYLAVTLLAERAARGYSWSRNSISDLGWTEPGPVPYPSGVVWVDSPLGWWFNIGSVLLGVTMMLGALALREVWEPGRLGRVITWCWWAVAAGTVATALVPGNVSVLAHSLLAQPIFVGSPLLLLLTARVLRGRAPRLAFLAAVLGLVALVGSAVLAVQLVVVVPFGLAERMALDGLPLWMLAAGATWAVRTPARAAQRTAGEPLS